MYFPKNVCSQQGRHQILTIGCPCLMSTTCSHSQIYPHHIIQQCLWLLKITITHVVRRRGQGRWENKTLHVPHAQHIKKYFCASVTFHCMSTVYVTHFNEFLLPVSIPSPFWSQILQFQSIQSRTAKMPATLTLHGQTKEVISE